MNGDEPVDPILQERYNLGQARVGMYVTDLRMHRMQRCEMFPICPGHVAAEDIEGMCDHELIGLACAALNAVADRDIMVENLRAELDRLRPSPEDEPQ